MAQLLDYLAFRGDLTLEERPFNEVDNLVFSELAYFNFNEVSEGAPITIRDAYQHYLTLEFPSEYINNDPIPLLKACAESERFGSMVVNDHVNIISSARQIQFSAVTFRLNSSLIYVAFRGTDNSIVGWREDFNLSYLEESPAQGEAVKYLNRVLNRSDSKIILGGHSKGGNLAVYAAAFCQDESFSRIAGVYSNDGPGFNRYVAGKPAYQSVLPLVKLFAPSGTIVAILYGNQGQRTYIKSTGSSGAEQHNPYTWMVERDHFVAAEGQEESSQLLEEALTIWMDSLNDQEKAAFFGNVFDVLDSSGATTLAEMGENRWASYNAILTAIGAQSDSTREGIHNVLKKFAHATRQAIRDETHKLLTKED